MKVPTVSEAELAVLQVLWDRGRLTTRQLTAELYPTQSASDFATVQKLVQRLEAKRLVARDRSSFAHTIGSTIDRNTFAARRLAETARKLAHGSLKPLLAHLVESDELSPDELEEIRKLLNKHRRKRE